MKNAERKCHAFWKTNKNPITMQRDETPEEYQLITAARKERASGRTDKFNFNN